MERSTCGGSASSSVVPVADTPHDDDNNNNNSDDNKSNNNDRLANEALPDYDDAARRPSRLSAVAAIDFSMSSSGSS